MEVYWDYLVAGFISPKRPGCFFFVVAPFCSCPASLVSRKFFAVGPGCAKCFFFVALRWAPRPFGGARAKKKTPPRVFFFCSGPGERQGKEKPRWKPARGQSKKKTPPRVFFLLRPRRKAREGEAPLEAGTGPGQNKKHHPGCFFFAPAPGKGRGRRSPVGRRHGARAKFFFFFCSGPVPASNGASPSPAFPRGRSKKKNTLGGVFFFALAPCRLPTELLLPLPFPGAAAKKKHPGWCFFFCSGPVPASNGASPSLAFPRGRSKKKKHPGWCFFFCCGPARTLTHSLRAWVAMPPPRRGGVFFFCCGPARTGVVFFFCGPARTLTHSRWAGAISARPGWCFVFLLRPRRVFLDNSKKCLGYYIGSKKTRRGHSKKKKHHFQPQKVYSFSFSCIVGNIIPKSVKCIHSATKIIWGW